MTGIYPQAVDTIARLLFESNQLAQQIGRLGALQLTEGRRVLTLDGDIVISYNTNNDTLTLFLKGWRDRRVQAATLINSALDHFSREFDVWVDDEDKGGLILEHNGEFISRANHYRLGTADRTVPKES